MTDQMKIEAAIEALSHVAKLTEERIAALELAIESNLNKGRYVILMDSIVIAACKKLQNGWNFSAMGVEAATFRECDAELSAKAFEKETGRLMHVMPVYPFYQQALESARTSLAFYRETLEKGPAQ